MLSVVNMVNDSSNVGSTVAVPYIQYTPRIASIQLTCCTSWSKHLEESKAFLQQMRIGNEQIALLLGAGYDGLRS